jgi:hypothetical protein
VAVTVGLVKTRPTLPLGGGKAGRSLQSVAHFEFIRVIRAIRGLLLRCRRMILRAVRKSGVRIAEILESLAKTWGK